MGSNPPIKKILKELQTNKKFALLVAFIIGFAVYVFQRKSSDPKEQRLKEATKKGLMALMIAYLAHIDNMMSPFFMVFIFDYFSSGWI